MTEEKAKSSKLAQKLAALEVFGVSGLRGRVGGREKGEGLVLGLGVMIRCRTVEGQVQVQDRSRLE